MDLNTDRWRVQLHDAWKSSGKTLDQIANAVRRVRRSYDYSGSELSRKLRGETGMRLDEYEVIAQALEVKLVWTPPPAAKS